MDSMRKSDEEGVAGFSPESQEVPVELLEWAAGTSQGGVSAEVTLLVRSLCLLVAEKESAPAQLDFKPVVFSHL